MGSHNKDLALQLVFMRMSLLDDDDDVFGVFSHVPYTKEESQCRAFDLMSSLLSFSYT